ncbi:Dihydroorotate dehydrogenase 2 [Pseudomonas sp. IT-P12]
MPGAFGAVPEKINPYGFSPVGASLLAIAVYQATSRRNVPTPSRAGSLPQGANDGLKRFSRQGRPRR